MTKPNKYLSKACPRYRPDTPACLRCADIVENMLKQVRVMKIQTFEIGFHPDKGVVILDEVVHALLARTNKITFTQCSPFCG